MSTRNSQVGFVSTNRGKHYRGILTSKEGILVARSDKHARWCNYGDIDPDLTDINPALESSNILWRGCENGTPIAVCEIRLVLRQTRELR